jgi:hypothetical protein
MPTAARLFAALFFSALGWFAADLVKPLLPEGTKTGLFNETMSFVGFLSGWSMAGARAGDGLWPSLGYGLTTSALIAFWGIFIFSGYDMLDLSLKSRYNGPMHAIKAMIAIAIDYFRLIRTPEIIGTMIVGGLFGGWLAEWASRRWS